MLIAEMYTAVMYNIQSRIAEMTLVSRYKLKYV